jgi:2-polyprenyl-3-methyl-5-hydroxy-6-metoxy-1,4-benzoquinol methylase
MIGKVSVTIEHALVDSIKSTFSDSHYLSLKVLDFGCGDGRFFNYFISKGFCPENIYGTEVSEIRVERCQTLGWKNAVLIKNREKLSFPDNFFHVITMIEVIEHIPCDDIPFYLKEFSRILKPNGFIILTTPNYPIKRVYDIFDAIRLQRWVRLKDDPTHICPYNYSKIKKTLVQFFPKVEMKIYKSGPVYPYIPLSFVAHKILGLAFKEEVEKKEM